jgi:hypothetical protein
MFMVAGIQLIVLASTSAGAPVGADVTRTTVAQV